MVDLKLLMQLGDSDQAFMVLEQCGPECLRYYVISSKVGCRVVTTGLTKGTLDTNIICLNLRLGALDAMLRKGHNCYIQYDDNGLVFKEEEEKFSFKPLQVLSMESFVTDILNKFFAFHEELTAYEKKKNSSQDFGYFEQSDVSEVTQEDDTEPELVMTELSFDEATEGIESDEEGFSLRPIVLDKLKAAAKLASLWGVPLEVYDGYATAYHPRTSMYLFVKGIEGNVAFPSEILERLLSDAKGQGFYEYKNGYVYRSTHLFETKNKKMRDPYPASETFVFMDKYLPDGSYDSSVLTRGIVREKYQINIGDFIPMMQTLAPKMNQIVLDLAEGVAKMTNDSQEVFTFALSVEDVKSIKLNRMLRGTLGNDTVELSQIKINSAVAKALPLFRESLTIYVKDNKIIFQNDTLYLVFGREA